MIPGIEILYGGISYKVEAWDERDLCVFAEEALREAAKRGLVAYIAHVTDPAMRERVREYLSGVMQELTHDMMEGM